ncbi:hypothetical protein EPO44_05370 [bacterium]|nr:MAG: hypothetical protein EPO44_05370 [bacterium]
MDELPISEVPERLIESVGHVLYDYSLGFVRIEDTPDGEDAVLVGSGTLITLQNKYAVLTAHHVVKALPRKDRLGLILSSKLNATTVPVGGLHYLEIARGSVDSEGPDLGAVVLPSPIVGSLTAKKSFYNLDLRREQLLNRKPEINNGVWFVYGFVEEWTVEEKGVGGYERAKGFNALAGMGGVNSSYTVGNYDYFIFPVSYGGRSEAPRNFGGMSGGGLWQVTLEKDSHGELTRQTPLLSGIVFYQGPIKANQSTLSCHGRRSVYEVVYEALKGAP